MDGWIKLNCVKFGAVWCSMDVWMYGCMDVWMYGCMYVWMYVLRMMDVCIEDDGCMDDG